MTATSAKPDQAAKRTIQGKPTDQSVKDEAFRLWIQYGRSVRLVSKQTGIEERTLYRWRVDDGWEEKRNQEAAAFLPGAYTESAIALRLAAHSAAVRLQQIAFEAMEHGTPPDRNEVQALSLIVDRGGFSPVGTKAAPEVASTAKSATELPALASASTIDDLLRLEAQMRAKRQKVDR